MAEAEGELEALALEDGAVAHADDLELLGEAGGDAGDHVLDQRAAEPVQSPAPTLVVGALDDEVAVLLAHHDGLGDLAGEGAHGALDDDGGAAEAHLDAGGHGDGLTTDAGHL